MISLSFIVFSNTRRTGQIGSSFWYAELDAHWYFSERMEIFIGFSFGIDIIVDHWRIVEELGICFQTKRTNSSAKENIIVKYLFPYNSFSKSPRSKIGYAYLYISPQNESRNSSERCAEIHSNRWSCLFHLFCPFILPVVSLCSALP